MIGRLARAAGLGGADTAMTSSDPQDDPGADELGQLGTAAL